MALPVGSPALRGNRLPCLLYSVVHTSGLDSFRAKTEAKRSAEAPLQIFEDGCPLTANANTSCCTSVAHRPRTTLPCRAGLGVSSPVQGPRGGGLSPGLAARELTWPRGMAPKKRVLS